MAGTETPDPDAWRMGSGQCLLLLAPTPQGPTIMFHLRLLAAAALVSLAACADVAAVPTAQSVAGLTPSGTVRLTETFAVGAGYGSGILRFQGQTVRFELVGSIVGGLGAERIEAAGEVYKLNSVADFPGIYSQGVGAAGLNTSTKGDLWLASKAGVIMHLVGTQSGGSLSLGRDEVYIKLVN
jgi:hypothetical protein